MTGGPHFGMIPRRVAKLRLSGRVHAVLDVIACHANPKRGNRAYLRRDTIANEAGIDCSKVSFCTRWLEKNGVVEISGRGGRGLANVYRIIPDTEAVTPAAATVAADNGADDGTVSDQNGADFGSKTVPILDQNGADFGTPTELEQKERTEPPNGGVARAHEGGDVSNDEVDRKQGVLLLPIDGGGDRKARLAVIDNYEPSPALIELAHTLGVDARAENVFGRWKRTRIADNRLPVDERAAAADFENWIRNQPAYDQREHARAAAIGSPRQPRALRRDAMAVILARVDAAEAAEAAQ